MYFKNMTSNDLRSYANQLGITVCENATNEELISIIKKTLPTHVLLEIEAAEKSISTGKLHVVDYTGSISDNLIENMYREIKSIFGDSLSQYGR